MRGDDVGDVSVGREGEEALAVNVPRRDPKTTDERLADLDEAGLLAEEDDVDLPDDERIVVEDVNEYVAEGDEREV